MSVTMSVKRAVPDADVMFESRKGAGKKYWPESTPILGATPTLPDAEVAGLVAAAKSAVEADARRSSS